MESKVNGQLKVVADFACSVKRFQDEITVTPVINDGRTVLWVHTDKRATEMK